MNVVPGNGHKPQVMEVRMTLIWRPTSFSLEGVPPDITLAYGMLGRAHELLTRKSIATEGELKQGSPSPLTILPPGARLR